MRTLDEIRDDARTLPGNTLLLTREEAEMCVESLVDELRLIGISRDTAKRSILAGQASLYGKQVTVGYGLD